MDILSWSYIREKWDHVGFQKYFQNTGWLFISKVLSTIVSLLATIYVTRRLGPGSFGQLSYAVSFVGVFSFIATLGIDNVLFRELIKYPEKKMELLGSANILKMLGGIFTAILVVISAFVFSQDDVSRILICILAGTFLFQSFQIVNFEFQAKTKLRYPSIISFAITVILNVLQIIVIIFNKGVIYLALILLLEPILTTIFFIIAYKVEFKEKISQWKFDSKIAKILMHDSWPMIITAAFSLIYARIDQILIKFMLTSSAVGIYSSAVNIAEGWYFIPGIILAVLFPAIMNAKKTEEKIYESRLKNLTWLLLALSVGVSLATSIFAPFIIHIIYGSAFNGAIIILQIYVWANVGIFIGALVLNYLIAENFRKIILFTSFVPMIANVILNLLWIPKYGIVGSAYATLISYSLGPLSVLCFKETRKKMVKIFTA